jgi:hypothetical protein
MPVLIGAEERGAFAVPQRPAETLIARRGGGTEGERWARGNHAIREERCALVLLSYGIWTIISSRKQRYLHIDAKTNHQGIYM